LTERVVITGIGAVTPVGLDRESTWQALLAGTSGIGAITQFEPGDLSTTIAAEVKGFDPASVLEGKRLRRSARFTQFAIRAAREAVADAALVVDDGNRGQIGVVVNAAVAGFGTKVEEVLNEHPLVADSIVVGLPDERWGQLIVAYVLPASAGLTAEELDKHAKAHPMLADYKRPRRYRFVDELPRTATGKKMHYVIRRGLADPDEVALLQAP